VTAFGLLDFQTYLINVELRPLAVSSVYVIFATVSIQCKMESFGKYEL